MTIRITKPGVMPETKVLSAVCTNCGCEFTFNPPDAKYEDDQRDGAFYRIACPTCRKDCFTSARVRQPA